MIGSSAPPFSVSAYSTRGGTSPKVWRSTIPSSSSARSRSESVRGLIPASERSSSQKRERPSERSRTSNSVHLPHTTSAVRHTGHVSSTAISLLYQLKFCSTPTLCRRPCAPLSRIGVESAPDRRTRHATDTAGGLPRRRRLFPRHPASGDCELGLGVGLAARLGGRHVLHRRALAAVRLH